MQRKYFNNNSIQYTYLTIITFFTLQLLTTNINAFRVCGNFCGANWCNGGKRSEWTHDDDHCGPEYLVPQQNKKTGGDSCADACCKQHDICCSPGGNDLPNSILLTKDCNREIVECLAACNKMDGSCTRGIIPVPSVAVYAAMDLVQNWCCGSRCPQPNNVVLGDKKENFLKIMKIKRNNLRHSEKVVKTKESIASSVNENKYLLSSAFSDEKCTAKDEVSTVATLCNACEKMNETASTIIRCLGADGNAYCSQEFYGNHACTGDPALVKNISCGGQSCEILPVTKTNNDSTMAMITDEPGILSRMAYPIVKIYKTGDCTGDVLSYLGFGGCKPAPPGETKTGGAKAWARVCKGDGLTYSCEYSDDACKNEIMCFPLRNTKPDTCQNLTPSKPGSALSSQEWICKGK